MGVAYDVVHLRRLPQGPFSALALSIRVAPFCSAMAMAMEMTSASAQALLAVSAHRRLVSLPPPAARRYAASAVPRHLLLPRRLVVVRATSQVDTGSTASPKATVPDTEVSITKVWLCALRRFSSNVMTMWFYQSGNCEVRASVLALPRARFGSLVASFRKE